MSNLGNSKKEATSSATKRVMIIPLVVLGENLQCQQLKEVIYRAITACQQCM